MAESEARLVNHLPVILCLYAMYVRRNTGPVYSVNSIDVNKDVMIINVDVKSLYFMV